MAKFRFLRGTFTGRLGEIVGSSWKGIPYIKTFSKPSNPRSEKQMAVRSVFKSVALFASALLSSGIEEFIPPAPKMTNRNITLKANAPMFEARVFTPASLQVARQNFDPFLTWGGIQTNANTTSLVVGVTTTLKTVSGGWGSHYQWLVVYNHKTGEILYIGHGISATITVPAGYQKADYVALFFVTSSDPDNNLLISKTYGALFA